MSFIWPGMLCFLFVVPLFVFLYVQQQRRRQKIFTKSARFVMFQAGAPSNSPGVRRHLPPALFMTGFAILMVALARPQTVVNVPRVQGTVILAFDVSGSMAADDLKPNRMTAAKTAAKDFVQRQPTSVQIGVVAFSDNGFAVQPPTDNQDEVLAAIDRLTPQRGTSLGNGIVAGLNTIAQAQSKGPLLYSNLQPTPAPTPTPLPKGTYTSAVIVLLTDGDNNENPDPMVAAQQAADRGVRVYTVGIGSATGTNVHVNGFTVFTQLDEATLQQIAQLTGGIYYNAQSTQDLISIYDHLSPQLVIKPEKTEVTPLFAGASVLLLLIGGVFSLFWFGRMP